MEGKKEDRNCFKTNLLGLEADILQNQKPGPVRRVRVRGCLTLTNGQVWVCSCQKGSAIEGGIPCLEPIRRYREGRPVSPPCRGFGIAGLNSGTKRDAPPSPDGTQLPRPRPEARASVQQHRGETEVRGCHQYHRGDPCSESLSPGGSWAFSVVGSPRKSHAHSPPMGLKSSYYFSGDGAVEVQGEAPLGHMPSLTSEEVSPAG